MAKPEKVKIEQSIGHEIINIQTAEQLGFIQLDNCKLFASMAAHAYGTLRDGMDKEKYEELYDFITKCSNAIAKAQKMAIEIVKARKGEFV